ncbi:MAG: hypothetical protein FJX57_14745 [Alphaproteobacteria bacterium]|nr:hypothetical protein [Alphaproteobacteria bacterium]
MARCRLEADCGAPHPAEAILWHAVAALLTHDPQPRNALIEEAGRATAAMTEVERNHIALLLQRYPTASRLTSMPRAN